jgi:CelD/BcsL family acetyltransferase involved in cellulose biosynthesis
MSNLQSTDVGAFPSAFERSRRAAPAGLAGVTVRVVESTAGFDGLERDWNALFETSATTVFQSFDWQRTWWKHFGERRKDVRLHIVTVRGEDGLLAVAPFYIETVRPLGVLRLRRLLFVGRRDSDYLDILAARGREVECIERIAAHLAQHRELFDMAVLEEITDRSPSSLLLYQAFLDQGWVTSRSVDELCPRTQLRRTWEETVAALPINYRREIRRRLRNIDKAYDVELELVQPGAQVEPAMREFIDMHQDRWVRAGYKGVFADSRQAAFQCDVANCLSRRGWLFLAFLRVHGQRCAANYGFSFRDVLSTYMPGAREIGDLSKYSPGRVLHARSMEWAIENGKTVYDFMRGREHYKYELGATDVPNWSIVAYPGKARLTAIKHRVDVIATAVRRRAQGEASTLLFTARKEGWFSIALRRHVTGRFRLALSDLLRVSRPRALEARRR